MSNEPTDSETSGVHHSFWTARNAHSKSRPFFAGIRSRRAQKAFRLHVSSIQHVRSFAPRRGSRAAAGLVLPIIAIALLACPAPAVSQLRLSTGIHSMITEEAAQLNGIPQEIVDNITIIRQGSIDEDEDRNPLDNFPWDILEIERWEGFFNWGSHFWNPEAGPNGGILADIHCTSPCLLTLEFTDFLVNFDGMNAYQRASYLMEEAVQFHSSGNLSAAYDNLGRIAHLLEDMGTPAHVHLDWHVWYVFCEECDSDSYEDYMHSYEGDTTTFEATFVTPYSPLTPVDVTTLGDGGYSGTDDLFRLFYNMAITSKDYDSDDAFGNDDAGSRRYYNGLDEEWDIADADCLEIGRSLVPQSISYVAALYIHFWDRTLPKTLTIHSQDPSSGVGVTVSLADQDNESSGWTPFQRTYQYGYGKTLTLTAPTAVGGNPFTKWTKDGHDFPSNTSSQIAITIRDDCTYTAVYAANDRPVLSNPRVVPSTGTTATTFEFLVDYFDADGDPPHPSYHSVTITGGHAGTMTLKSGSPANGTYRYLTSLPVGNYMYTFLFADTTWKPAQAGWYYGPNVHLDTDAVINPIVQCAVISGDLSLQYSRTSYSGPWTDIPITGAILDPITVPAGSVVWFRADVESPNHQFSEFVLIRQGQQVDSSTNNNWSVTLQPDWDEVALEALFQYTPQQYTISGTVTQGDGTPVPGGVDLDLTSATQSLSLNSTDGTFSFSGVFGGVPVTITPSATNYAFTPSTLTFANLDDDQLGSTITAFASDDCVPTTAFVQVPSPVSDQSEATFEWAGTDNVSAPGSLLFQYQLDGVDGDWSAWSSTTSAVYDLPNGTYQMHVRAQDESGNINQVPTVYEFVVNAAPQVTAAVRSLTSVWASRITLENPLGSGVSGDQVVLLPEHSAISDDELTPVRLYAVGDPNLQGASEMMAAALGVPVRIEESGPGWLLTLPTAIAPGETAEYEILWGKVEYFGWNEFVAIPHAFPNVGQAYGSDFQSFGLVDVPYLTQDLTLWLDGRKYRYPYGSYGDSRTWWYWAASDANDPVFEETLLRYEPGQPSGALGPYNVMYRYGQTVGNDARIIALMERAELGSGPTQISFVASVLTHDGQLLSTFESSAVHGGVSLPSSLIRDRVWFVGKIYNDAPADPEYLWMQILDSYGSEVVPRTTIGSVQHPNGANISGVEAVAIGSHTLVLWEHNWQTSQSDFRSQLEYQVRSDTGQSVVGTTVLTSVLPDSTSGEDSYYTGSSLTDATGKAWISYMHVRSGQATEFWYVILDTDGSIWKGADTDCGAQAILPLRSERVHLGHRRKRNRTAVPR
jgi:hypothetical protein